MSVEGGVLLLQFLAVFFFSLLFQCFLVCPRRQYYKVDIQGILVQLLGETPIVYLLNYNINTT